MVAKRKKTEGVESGDTSNAPTQIGGGEASNPSTQIEIGVGEAMNPLSPRENRGETPNPPNPRDIGETSNPPSQREIGGGEDSNPSPPREETGGRRETVTIDTDLLDCSICTNPLCPPLYQCMNGHVACPSCWSEIQHKCHICNVAVVTRNITLEKVLESVHLPCTYASLGCPKSVSYSQRQVHTDTCDFGPSLCPIPGCLYKAFSGEWWAHFLKDHRWPGCDYDYGDSCNIQFDKEVDLGYTLLGPGKDLFLLVKEPILNVGYTITLFYIDLTHQGQNVFPYELEVAIIRNGTQRLMEFHAEAVSIKEWKRGEERVGSFLILLEWQSPKIELLIYDGYDEESEPQPPQPYQPPQQPQPASFQPQQPPSSPPSQSHKSLPPSQPPLPTSPMPSVAQPTIPAGATTNRFSPLLTLTDMGVELPPPPPPQAATNRFSPLLTLTDMGVELPPPPPPQAADSKDPWEIALRNDKEKKRKGKYAESKSSTEETRNSLRVKLNQMVESREAQTGVIDKTSAKLSSREAQTGLNGGPFQVKADS